MMKRSSSSHISRGAIIPMTMPIPPDLGTAAACTFRLSGLSIMPIKGAILIIIGVIAIQIAMATNKPEAVWRFELGANFAVPPVCR